MCFWLPLFADFVFAVFFAVTAPPCAADTFAYVPAQSGTILGFRIDSRTGSLARLPRVTDTEMRRLVDLSLSADGRFLYAYRAFDVSKDGFSTYNSDFEHAHAARIKPTGVCVYAIEPTGALRLVQRFAAPGPVGQFLVHRGGRFVVALTDGGAFLYETERGTAHPAAPGSGRLRFVKRLTIDSGMGMENGAGVLAGWWLLFSPSGKYLYDHSYGGFQVDVGSSLTRYRMNEATGDLAESGRSRGWNATLHPTNDLSDGVWCIKNRTAFLESDNGFTVCRVDADETIANKGKRVLKWIKYSHRDTAPNLIPHPFLPLVVYRGSEADPYTIWRIVAPGQIRKVGAFRGAFPRDYQQRFFIAPNGRFAYEASASSGIVLKPRIAVWAISPGGTRLTKSAQTVTIPFGSDLRMTFAEIPAKAMPQ